MSKVEAYICDFANHLVPADEAVGINPVQDLFDIQLSYPTILNPARTNIHYCTGCYKAKVLIFASNIASRKKNEVAYKQKVKELSYSLREQTVRQWRLKNMHKKNPPNLLA